MAETFLCVSQPQRESGPRLLPSAADANHRGRHADPIVAACGRTVILQHASMPLDVSSHPFFSRFTPVQAEKIARQVRVSRYLNNALIFDEGADPESICLVLNGKVVLVKKTPGGAPQTIAHKNSGDYFGELGVLD